VGFESFKFEKNTKLTLNCIVYLPQSYNTIEKWPLILSLHGSGGTWK
jgi:predicted peptidase